MNLSVRNLTEFAVEAEAFEELIHRLDEHEPSRSSNVSVALVDDETMRDLHETYYGEEGTTDVLTFDYEDDTLEVVLNPYQHRRQVRGTNKTLNEELGKNLIHGYLHGKGYDHQSDEGQHLALQEQLMEKLEISSFPLIESEETIGQ